MHVCKLSTLSESYQMAKRNNGAPGIDGITFDDIEKAGVESFLRNIQEELIKGTYQSTRNRIKEIPKANGKNQKTGYCYNQRPGSTGVSEIDIGTGI